MTLLNKNTAIQGGATIPGLPIHDGITSVLPSPRAVVAPTHADATSNVNRVFWSWAMVLLFHAGVTRTKSSTRCNALPMIRQRMNVSIHIYSSKPIKWVSYHAVTSIARGCRLSMVSYAI
jgi:hypothetical protein